MNMVDRPGAGTQSPQPLAQEKAAGSLDLGMEQDDSHREKESRGGCSKQRGMLKSRVGGMNVGGSQRTGHSTTPEARYILFFFKRGKYYIRKRQPECLLLWKP